MKRLLVGSVYAPCKRNQTWLNLQRRFLGETTKVDYDFTVYLNRTDPGIFETVGVPILGRSEKTWGDMCREHAFALNELLTYFRSRVNGYENFLILDSDAFPFQENWLERLLIWMREDDFLPEKQFAAACRAENLDTFPHPCAFFIRGSFLREAPPDFNFSLGQHINLAGFQFEDVACAVPTRYQRNHVWLPLMRSNVWNPHPILSAVYGGMFYHHGAGSRPLELRSISLRTYDNSYPRFQHGDTERQLYAEISRNPKIFIRQLTGGA